MNARADIKGVVVTGVKSARWLALLLAVLAVSLLAGCGKLHEKWHEMRGHHDRVVLINTFTVPAGKLEQTIAQWEKAREFLSEQDGYISTRLHQSLGNDARYRLVNVAKWESAAHFRAAAQALRASGVFRPISGVEGAPHLYTVIRRDKR